MRLRLPLAVLAVLAACGETEPAADEPTTPTATAPATTSPATPPKTPGTLAPPQLDGHEYVSSEVTGQDLVAGSKIRLTFDNDQIGASAGCNQLGGTWSLEGAVLVVPEDMAMTEMACDPPALMDQDTWLASFLAARPTVAVDGDTLILTGDDATITLVDREVAEPDRSLEGTDWIVDGLVSDDAVSSVPVSVRPPTLTFDAGEVMVDTGCNTGSGDYDATDTEITFGPLATTRMACEDDATSVEAHVLGVLEGTVTYEIEAGTLTLSHGDQGLVLQAQS